MIEREDDRAHVGRVIDWLVENIYKKYSAGIRRHGGHLPDKGGVLHELECEVLDQAVYASTLREQLGRVETFLEDGRIEDAMIALRHILHGTPADRLPGAARSAA